MDVRNIKQVMAPNSSGRTRIAACQVKTVDALTKADQLGNARRHLELVTPLINHVQAVLFPELSTVGLLTDSHPDSFNLARNLAEDLNGEVISLFAESARQTGAWLGFGLYLKDEAFPQYSYVLTGPAGERVYCHQTNGLDTRGPATASVVIDGHKVTAAICRNSAQANVQAEIRAAQPDLVIVPAFMRAAHRVRNRSVAVQADLLMINQSGDDYGLSTFYGYNPADGRWHEHSLDRAEEALIVII
jgi:predicted amidohydrolase